jgi:hypothetical protein
MTGFIQDYLTKTQTKHLILLVLHEDHCHKDFRIRLKHNTCFFLLCCINRLHVSTQITSPTWAQSVLREHMAFIYFYIVIRNICTPTVQFVSHNCCLKVAGSKDDEFGIRTQYNKEAAWCNDWMKHILY